MLHCVVGVFNFFNQVSWQRECFHRLLQLKSNFIEFLGVFGVYAFGPFGDIGVDLLLSDKTEVGFAGNNKTLRHRQAGFGHFAQIGTLTANQRNIRFPYF